MILDRILYWHLSKVVKMMFIFDEAKLCSNDYPSRESRPSQSNDRTNKSSKDLKHDYFCKNVSMAIKAGDEQNIVSFH